MEVGVRGDAQAALARRGLAEIQTVYTPWRRVVYRLTDAGERLRRERTASALAGLPTPPGGVPE